MQRIGDILIRDAMHVEPKKASMTYASVLVIIHYHGATPHIILTKRSTSVRLHGGEVCFPGGGYDPAEDKNLLDTAIRETNEELGLLLNTADIIGRLQPVKTLTSNFIIYPFVTIKLTIASHKSLSAEVEKVIDAPLYRVLDSITPDLRYSNLSSKSHLYKFKFKEEIVWGATSRILKQLHDCLYKKSCKIDL
jgi:8-oxo-dGTP pyrophosphatase MutT (NUDIX family)